MHAVNRHYYCARKKDSLTDYLKKCVYAERFSYPLRFVSCIKNQKKSALKYNDMRLQQEVDSISVLRLYRSKKEKSRKKRSKVWGKETSGSGQRWEKFRRRKNSGSPAKVDFKAVDSRRVLS